MQFVLLYVVVVSLCIALLTSLLQFAVQVRNKLAGKIGDVTLRYERATGRYEAVDLQQVG